MIFMCEANYVHERAVSLLYDQGRRAATSEGYGVYSTMSPDMQLECILRILYIYIIVHVELVT